MFKKLTSNLPFNPSLINELTFYARRVHRESSVRRAGLIVMALAIVLQTFAVFSPPQPTLASSSNDMITGGVTSRDQTLAICNNNTRDYKTILAYYGISCGDLANAPVVTIKSTDHSKKLYSMGHLAYGKTGETAVTIPGVSGNMYLRYLWSWDTGAYSTYKAFSGKTSTGTQFYILFDCGNLTFVGLPKPAPKPAPTPVTPKPTPCPFNTAIAATDSKCPKPCAFNSSIAATDSKCPKACAFNSAIAANDSKCPSACKFNAAIASTNPQCPTPCPSNSTIASTDTKCSQPPKCALDTSLLATDSKCPKPCAFNSSIAATDSKCPKACAFNSSISTNNTECPAPCTSNTSISSKDAACKQPEKCALNQSLLATDSKCPKPCAFNSSIAATDSKCPTPCAFNPSIASGDVTCPKACPSNGAISDKDPNCKSCSQSKTSSDVVSCLVYTKTVANNTQGIVNANDTTAKAKDVLTYTLTTTNNGKVAVTGYVVNENVSDLLDYAVIEDLHGGQKNSENIVSWPATDIAAGKNITKLITIRIKDAIPQTPASASDPGHYDLTMTNVYGNTTTVKLPASVAKSTEVVATKLPNTGPGTSMVLCALLVTFIGYFFARTRLFTKELGIIRADYGSTGGIV